MTRPSLSQAAKSNLRKRYRAEKRFRIYGMLAVSVGAIALTFLLVSIFSSGYSAFWRTEFRLSVNLDPEVLGVKSSATEAQLFKASYRKPVRNALYAKFEDVTKRRDKKQLTKLISNGAELELRQFVIAHPQTIGQQVDLWLTAASDIDQIHKGKASREIDEKRRRVNDKQLGWYDQLVATGDVRRVINWRFFTRGDSRSPELAGVGGAIAGSFIALLVCFLCSFPLGVSAAVYLEEFAPRNRFTDLIEANINNLAAVPSIIFGLLGLSILLNAFGMPRGTPLVGGVVLSLMTLPTIIIACRSALKAVPPSIREAALGIGASPVQVVLHHVLPLAMPGTLTGTIIGLARALGETAPLLMIGMVAFIVNVPGSPLDPSAALPVQIYLWAESAERGFVEKTAAAVIIILGFLILMNIIAVILRARFERRW